MDINCLPNEVIEKIALCLPLADLLSCSLVCVRWRNIINSNKVWLPLALREAHLDRGKAGASHCLIEEPSFVSPRFSFPEPTCDTLPPPCFWKKRFMQEVHISRNWRMGRYMSFDIASSSDSQDIEADEEVLAAAGSIDRHFLSWSIGRFPLQLQYTKYSLQHVSADFFKLVNGVLVVVQCTLLQVYVKDEENNFKLKYRCLFNKEERDSLLPTQPDLSNWYRDNVGLYPCDIDTCCNHNGQYFLGAVFDSHFTTKIHVWDLKKCKKSHSFQVPFVNYNIMDIHFLLTSSHLYLLLNIRDPHREYTNIHQYSLEKCSYTDFLIKLDNVIPFCLVDTKYIVNIDRTGKVMSIWDNITGYPVHQMTCLQFINKEVLNFVTPELILFSEDNIGSGTAKLFNVKSLNVMFEMIVNHRITVLLLVRPNILLIGGQIQLGVWDMKTSTKLHTLDYRDCIWSSVNSRKIIVESDEELYLVHFW